ncbi:hypothetical protein GGR16_001725 [Chelatococcus caeni]|uniref:Uncharacterized protein n=1 Tax=Chelatococcus caeni TaxID=1348468 RepID=A0A840BZK5_9HYPH|nr:hypothetical protein [Chelatococcus caeni]
MAAWGAIASGCSTAPGDPVIRTELVRPSLPPAAREPCPAPVPLPDRSITSGEVTRWWGRDRAELRACEQRRAAAVAAIDGSASP